MEKLLKYVLEKICSKPDAINIEKVEEDSYITFTISLDEDDKGKVIGKHGRNIKSIRQLLVILAKQENKTISLNVE